MMTTADAVVCGAGIAGIATAYQLAVKHGVKRVILADERAPLTLTSDKSSECYRNWWPGPGDDMVSLMNRSIDILEELAVESHNLLRMNRRGYLYATADPKRIPIFRRAALESEALGAGSAREHNGQSDQEAYLPSLADGFTGQPTGSDLLLDRDLIRRHFPYLSEGTVAVVHARRCGWLSAQQLGMYMLERAREHGVEFVRAAVTAVEMDAGRVRGVQLGNGSRVATEGFFIAAGPLTPSVAKLIGVELPLFSERHLKIAFDDYLGIIPRDAPLLIWTDPMRLDWTAEEQELFAEDPHMRWLLDELPPGAHGRPEGGPESHTVMMLWTYDTTVVEPTWPLPIEPHYHEVVLRGLAGMIPGLSAYFGKAAMPYVDGGYYTKTKENRLLAGPLPVAGAYLVAGLSGYGIMASCAAAELAVKYFTGAPLPDYAPAFRLERYNDPDYLKLLDAWGASGQL
jgi:glycine/D-amino acid oxidase-like deaminating enzyme